MAGFEGFPAGSLKTTPIPNLVFSALLPQIDSLHELKVTLHVFWLLYRKRGYPRFASLSELLADGTLLAGLKESTDSAEDLVRDGLARATTRGTLLHLTIELNDAQEIYFMNSAHSRSIVDRLRSGKLDLGQVVRSIDEGSVLAADRSIFTLYEQNIGLLTPLIAEELSEAERLYPYAWIEEAFRESVSYNRRNWAYIKRILERWALEGRDHEEDRGRTWGIRERAARYAAYGTNRRK